jgi:hypothetical protein
VVQQLGQTHGTLSCPLLHIISLTISDSASKCSHSALHAGVSEKLPMQHGEP